MPRPRLQGRDAPGGDRHRTRRHCPRARRSRPGPAPTDPSRPDTRRAASSPLAVLTEAPSLEHRGRRATKNPVSDKDRPDSRSGGKLTVPKRGRQTLIQTHVPPSICRHRGLFAPGMSYTPRPGCLIRRGLFAPGMSYTHTPPPPPERILRFYDARRVRYSDGAMR